MSHLLTAWCTPTQGIQDSLGFLLNVQIDSWINLKNRMVFFILSNSGNLLFQHPAFREHAARFMRILEEGVANLDHLDSRFTPTMLALGASHVRCVPRVSTILTAACVRA